MTALHLILTVSWPVAGGGMFTSTSDCLVDCTGTRQEQYRAAMARIRIDGKVPEGVNPNTMFFSLEPNELNREQP